MSSNLKCNRLLGAASALAVAISLASAGGAAAQVATSTLRGSVVTGQQSAGAGTVVATEVATGFVSRGRLTPDGNYVIPGLRPGTYRVVATAADGQTATDTVTLGVGQVGTLNLALAGSSATAGGAIAVEDVIVTGRRLFEVRTPEVATNVSQQQINNLPQVDRNFLNFAALAPGVVVQQDPSERTIYAGAQSANAINVFIDGQGQKSNIIDGGMAGQDDSRGNPFPQGAVQEFRVLTQNFKAEYEQASSAIISAVTRSGTNELHGDFFVTYQDTDWQAQNIFAKRRGEERAQLDRLQYGGNISGPIIRDRLHYFLSYERKDETRSNSIFLNQTQYEPLFADELGTFEAPFEQDMFFGKLSWQLDDRQILELSGLYRTEKDIRGFGNQDAYSRANAVNIDTRSLVLKHQYQGDSFLNVLTVDYFLSRYNPQAENFDLPGTRYVAYRDSSTGTNGLPGFQFNYNTADFIFAGGGNTNNQNIEDQSITIKNDLTFNEIEWAGRHTIKVGAKYSMRDYYVQKFFNRNPQFTYDVTANPEIFGSTTIPTRVSLNLPTDPADVSNEQIGLYIQDDWQITDKLELNLGLRWDYETNAVNNDWVTPDVVRDVVGLIVAHPSYVSRIDINDYISDGDRDPFDGAFQPRIGFSYDIFGDEQTVLFGGAGRYYDRVGFNFAFSERFSPFNLSRNIYFSPSGGAFGGRTDTIAWDPSYATAAGLDALLGGVQGRGEIFLIKNDLKIPYTDQFNLGVRQKFGDVQAAVTFSYARTQDEFQWSRLNVNEANTVTVRPSQFTNPDTGQPYAFNDSVFYANNDRERRYKAMYVTLDRPYTEESGYGFNLAYTLADGEQNGSRDQGMSPFDFDYATVAQSPWFNTPGVERHRIVASGTMRLPWDILASSVVTLGSGRPFNMNNFDGGKPNWYAAYPEKYTFLPGLDFATRQVDLRFNKQFNIGGHQIEGIVDAINIFNHRNYNGFNQTYRTSNSATAPLNPTFGTPTSQALPTRSVQLTVRYSF